MSTTESPRDMLGRHPLTPVAEARSRLLAHLRNRHCESRRLPLLAALDRVTAEAIIAPEDLPPADRSTMDGFAVIAADTFGATQAAPAYLDIVGEVLMGQPPARPITRGTCQRIPTGGLLPEGADGVVMLEQTVPVDETMIEVVRGIGTGTNVIRRGDDIRAGESALPAGHRLRPQDLGLLAGLGIADVAVNDCPRVAVIATGDEIVDHRQQATEGTIRNINSVTLAALVSRYGGTPVDFGIVTDQEDAFVATLSEAVAETDLVLFSGGSSVGVRDLGERTFAHLGNPGIIVHGVALKPGKPVLIGICRDTPIFGLPGHPVSAMVCFDLFVRPALDVLSGLAVEETDPAPSIRARLTRSINSAAGRLDVVRGRLFLDETGHWAMQPILGRSGAISTMSRANGYFLVAEHTQGHAAGEHVEVYLFR